MNTSSAEWWLKENRIEAVVCLMPTLDNIFEGVHVVAAIGHDGMVAHAVVDTGRSEASPFALR